MKALILTLAVAGFMSTAHAGVYSKYQDPKLNGNDKTVCQNKTSTKRFDKSNTTKRLGHKKKVRTGNRLGTN